MISKLRLRFDFLGQTIIICAVALLFFFSSGRSWTNLSLGILLFWQMASAIHLFLAYRFVARYNFFRIGLVLIISLPIWFHLIGSIAYLPVIGLVLWYFYRTFRDMLIVNSRPRSFWDLT